MPEPSPAPDLSLLLLAAASLAALVAVVMTTVAATQKVGRGYSVWLAAQWSAACGLALLLLGREQVVVQLLGQWLLLQWPLTIVLGLRRFHGRQPLRGRAMVDVTLFGLTAIGVLAGAGVTPPGFGWNAGMALVHTYTAALLWATPSVRASAALRLLAGMLGIAAVLHAAVAAGVASQGSDMLPLTAPASALLVAGMGFVALLLTHERTVRELQDSRRRLQYLANIDMLTQVPNRRHFGELARSVLQREAERTAAVLMFDIDHFKQINDALGHAAGDRALRIVSRCVQDTLRANDVAGRHGGDEFVLLLPGTGLRDAMTVAARIVQRAQAMAKNQDVPQLSLSFGVVHMAADESLDEAIRRADQALYEAKRQGRGRAVSADGDVHRPVFVESRRLGLI